MAGLIHGPLPLFLLQAILIIAASRAIGLLTRRIRQPMVIAEIVAGILLGPSLLGWAAPHAASAVRAYVTDRGEDDYLVVLPPDVRPRRLLTLPEPTTRGVL